MRLIDSHYRLVNLSIEVSNQTRILFAFQLSLKCLKIMKHDHYPSITLLASGFQPIFHQD